MIEHATWLGTTLRLASDPGLSLTDFNEHAASVPRLTPELLRVANSSLYGMEGRITRLDRAVLILGQGAVSCIATSILVSEATRGLQIGPVYGDALWLHCLEVGVLAELIALEVGRIRPSHAYCVGLLHDLGVLDLHREHDDAYAEVLTRAANHEDRLEALEQEIFKESHGARIGALARQWGAPNAIVEALGAHHTPLDASAEARGIAACVNAAHCVMRTPGGAWSDADPDEEAEAAFEALELMPTEVAEIRPLASARLEEAAAIYR